LSSKVTVCPGTVGQALRPEPNPKKKISAA
jgi:hypothetical protein